MSEPRDLAARRESDDRIREDRIALAARAERDDVALSRLLGREPELYGEWDRERAEVEFRLALVPALLFLAVAISVRSPVLALWAIPLAVVVSWGLLRDAARSEQHAQEVVFVALANERIQSPTIERLLAEADEAARYGTRELLESAARKASDSLSEALQSLEHAGVSEPASAAQAAGLVQQAAAAFDEGKPLFATSAIDRFDKALNELHSVADAWSRVIQGGGQPTIDMAAHLQAAHAHHAGFRQAIREQLASIDSPGTHPGAG